VPSLLADIRQEEDLEVEPDVGLDDVLEAVQSHTPTTVLAGHDGRGARTTPKPKAPAR
jgi:hypothetical protein